MSTSASPHLTELLWYEQKSTSVYVLTLINIQTCQSLETSISILSGREILCLGPFSPQDGEVQTEFC